MSVSDGYLSFVLDQLRAVVPLLRARRMFGAHGLYADDLFFAVIDDDTLFLKVDDQTRADYESRGMPAFRPFEGAASMNYSQLPEDLLEDPESLRHWVERAIAVAGRARAKRRTGSSAKPTPAKTSARKKAKKKSPRKTRPKK
ncbi:MAG: TfoX/Sxy family protein [bacterium]